MLCAFIQWFACVSLVIGVVVVTVVAAAVVSSDWLNRRLSSAYVFILFCVCAVLWSVRLKEQKKKQHFGRNHIRGFNSSTHLIGAKTKKAKSRHVSLSASVGFY